MLDPLVFCLGYAVMVIGGLSLICKLLMGCVWLWEAAVWKVLETLYGIKVLREFIRWRRDQVDLKG
jgi:hypothetical protein